MPVMIVDVESGDPVPLSNLKAVVDALKKNDYELIVQPEAGQAWVDKYYRGVKYDHRVMVVTAVQGGMVHYKEELYGDHMLEYRLERTYSRKMPIARFTDGRFLPHS